MCVLMCVCTCANVVGSVNCDFLTVTIYSCMVVLRDRDFKLYNFELISDSLKSVHTYISDHCTLPVIFRFHCNCQSRNFRVHVCCQSFSFYFITDMGFFWHSYFPTFPTFPHSNIPTPFNHHLPSFIFCLSFIFGCRCGRRWCRWE